MRGAPVDDSVTRDAGELPEQRASVLGPSALAPVALALTTIAALAGAVLALLPAALARRPAGRLGPRRARERPAAETDRHLHSR